VVSFTPRPLYLKGNSPQYPLARRLSELQTLLRREKSIDRKDKIFLGHPTYCVVTILTELPSFYTYVRNFRDIKIYISEMNNIFFGNVVLQRHIVCKTMFCFCFYFCFRVHNSWYRYTTRSSFPT
jgi:hypothetical protein